MRRNGPNLLSSLRIEAMHNGAWQSPATLSESDVWRSGAQYGTMDTSGIGQAATTSRSSRTYAGGGLTPQVFEEAGDSARLTPTGGINSPLTLETAAVTVNARAANPSRGMSPLSRLR